MSQPGVERIHVAIAVLAREGRVLVRKRRPREHLEGLWEFPGGKIHDGEEPRDAAAREVREEMGLEAGSLDLLDTFDHNYPDRSVRLSVFTGAAVGDPAPPDGAEWSWVTPEELAQLPIPAANRALVRRLREEGLMHRDPARRAQLR